MVCVEKMNWCKRLEVESESKRKEECGLKSVPLKTLTGDEIFFSF